MRFWGVRGSIPSPGTATRRFGGNTPCVEVRFGDQLVIFDLGSGARGLGESFGREGTKAAIFVSHYHYDHLQGLPFFTPMFNPKNAFVVYGPSRNGLGIKEILAGQMVQPYFPVTAEMVFRAHVEYREFSSGQTLEIGGAKISAIELNHPGGNLGYRIDYKGKSVVYATDIEHGSKLDERFYEFSRGADLLIYDAMYTEDEYRGRAGPPRTGWGHSTWQAAVAAADTAGVKRLVLFHHDPTRDDEGMEKMLREVRKYRPEAVAAREQMVLTA
ncbi:MAG: MBL fold metallo-hydrolase [Myxococcaceae bacterium]|nr:MBL fold metallo-hydrolase [Myxococcaceae bacterium]